MRATYANGVVAAWEEAGYDPFTAVYGTSAGGALAGWWSAGQAREALETWRYAQDERIMSYKRWLLRRGPLLDHDRLFEIVYQDEHRLDVEAIKACGHPVVVTLTDADTGQLHYQDIREGPTLDWLRATGRLPLATGDPVRVNGHRFVDGGLTEPVPVRKAIEDGAREVVVLLNKPPSGRTSEPWLVEFAVRNRFPALEGLVAEHHELHARSLSPAFDPPGGVRVHIIRPEKSLPVHRLTRDLDQLEESMRAGERDGRAFLETRGLEA